MGLNFCDVNFLDYSVAFVHIIFSLLDLCLLFLFHSVVSVVYSNAMVALLVILCAKFLL